MADVTESPPPVDASEVPPVVDDASSAEAINGTTGRIPSTPEGMMIAYGSLVVMALIPIFFGAFRYRAETRRERMQGQPGQGCWLPADLAVVVEMSTGATVSMCVSILWVLSILLQGPRPSALS